MGFDNVRLMLYKDYSNNYKKVYLELLHAVDPRCPPKRPFAPTTSPKQPTKNKKYNYYNRTAELLVYQKIAQRTGHDHHNDDQHWTSSTPMMMNPSHHGPRKWNTQVRDGRVNPWTITNRIPVAPRSMQHKHERLALGTF